mmetsp:Transcript_22377/g.64189  ORF Transcript_22377/g.64189 Transcript_22377/m.64189 type:complete len:250 (+) Transcript_22377:1011-1760(+)
MQKRMTPSLPSLLLLTEMLFSLRCFFNKLASESAAPASIPQLFSHSVVKCGHFSAAAQTISAPAEPMALLARSKRSSDVLLRRSRAWQPSALRPIVWASRTRKGLNFAMPVMSSSKPLSPMPSLWDTSSCTTPGSALSTAVGSAIIVFSALEAESADSEAHSSSRSSSGVGWSQQRASSPVVSTLRSLDCKTNKETCRVNLSRFFQRSARTRAVMQLMSIWLSEMSTPSHSLPRMTRFRITFLEKWFMF